MMLEKQLTWPLRSSTIWNIGLSMLPFIENSITVQPKKPYLTSLNNTKEFISRKQKERNKDRYTHSLDSIKNHVGVVGFTLLGAAIIFNAMMALLTVITNSDILPQSLFISVALFTSSIVVGVRYQAAAIDELRWKRISDRGNENEKDSFRPYRLSTPKNYDLIIGLAAGVTWFLMFNVGPYSLLREDTAAAIISSVAL